MPSSFISRISWRNGTTTELPTLGGTEGRAAGLDAFGKIV